MLSTDTLSTIVAQAAPASEGSALMGMLPIALMFVILYFLMIRPQQKKAKEHQKMVAALQKGDEIVTNGGLAGRISKVGENYMTVSVADIKDAPVDVIVQKSAVATLLPKGTLKTL